MKVFFLLERLWVWILLKSFKKKSKTFKKGGTRNVLVLEGKNFFLTKTS